MQRYHSGRTRCQVNQECEGLRLRSFRASRLGPCDQGIGHRMAYTPDIIDTARNISSVHTSNALALNEPWSASR